MSSSTGWRVLGVGVPDVSDWREQAPQGKWSQFFSALADRVEVVDVLRPPSWVRPTRHVNLARTFHPLRSRWKSRAGFSRWLARERTRAVQHLLDEHLGEVDLIMQLQTLFTPGVDRHGTPYAV
jgi:hypothetical protein